MSHPPHFPDAPEGVVPEGDAPAGALVGAPLAQTIRLVAIPAVIANLLMTLFHNVDTFWIGRYLGADSLAAATSSVFWIWLVISIAEMVSIGVHAIAARRHGERRPDDAARTAGEGLLLALLLGGAIALLTPFAIDWIFRSMRISGALSSIGIRYLGTYLLGMPFIFAFFAIDAAFRASGDTRTPLYILAITTACGLVLDPVLILGLGIVAPMGIAGAAVATLVPRTLGAVIGTVLLVRRRLLRLARPRAAVIARIARIGAPPAMTGVAFSAIYVVLTRTTTKFGTPALAALGLGFRVESVVYVASVGFGVAIAAIVGQSMGARDVKRAEHAGWMAMAIVTVMGAIMGVIMLVYAPAIASIFSTDAAVISEAASYLRIAALSQLFLGAEIVLESAMGGAGYTLAPMIASMSITASRVPIAAWAAAQWGTRGIWWTLALTAAARGVAMAVLWKLGRWKRVSV